jgi:hypothetical protein
MPSTSANDSQEQIKHLKKTAPFSIFLTWGILLEPHVLIKICLQKTDTVQDKRLLFGKMWTVFQSFFRVGLESTRKTIHSRYLKRTWEQLERHVTYMYHRDSNKHLKQPFKLQS